MNNSNIVIDKVLGTFLRELRPFFLESGEKATQYYSAIRSEKICGQDATVCTIDIPVFSSKHKEVHEVNRIIICEIREISQQISQDLYARLRVVGRKAGKIPENFVNKNTVIVIAKRRKGFVRAAPQKGYYILVRKTKKRCWPVNEIVSRALHIVANWLYKRYTRLMNKIVEKGIELYGFFKKTVLWVKSFVENVLCNPDVQLQLKERKREREKERRLFETYKSTERIKQEVAKELSRIARAKPLKD